MSPATPLDAQLTADLARRRDDRLLRRLRTLPHPGRHVTVDGRRLLNLAGNDYLGLAEHPALKRAAIDAIERYGVGSGASRLVAGHLAPHAVCEAAFAAFKHADAALLFCTGYTANLAVLTALAGPGDLILQDKLNHASLLDAARFSGATVRTYPHRNLDKLERLLNSPRATHASNITPNSPRATDARDSAAPPHSPRATHARGSAATSHSPRATHARESAATPHSPRATHARESAATLAPRSGPAMRETPRREPRRFIVTDSIFSMDGTAADLPALCDLADRHDATLIVDEAHATGVLGASGAGLIEHQGVTGRVPVVISTASKALGSLGGLVTASRPVIDTLVNHARAFVYSTSPPPAQAAAITAALAVVRDEPWRRQRLAHLSQRLRESLTAAGWPHLVGRASRPSSEDIPTPILPLHTATPDAALALARRLEQRGVLAVAIRPPTVPPGTARVRLSLRADLTDLDLDHLLTAVGSPSPPSP